MLRSNKGKLSHSLQEIHIRILRLLIEELNAGKYNSFIDGVDDAVALEIAMLIECLESLGDYTDWQWQELARQVTLCNYAL